MFYFIVGFVFFFLGALVESESRKTLKTVFGIGSALVAFVVLWGVVTYATLPAALFITVAIMAVTFFFGGLVGQLIRFHP